jgi:hypothetical protein
MSIWGLKNAWQLKKQIVYTLQGTELHRVKFYPKALLQGRERVLSPGFSRFHAPLFLGISDAPTSHGHSNWTLARPSLSSHVKAQGKQKSHAGAWKPELITDN